MLGQNYSHPSWEEQLSKKAKSKVNVAQYHDFLGQLLLYQRTKLAADFFFYYYFLIFMLRVEGEKKKSFSKNVQYVV